MEHAGNSGGKCYHSKFITTVRQGSLLVSKQGPLSSRIGRVGDRSSGSGAKVARKKLPFLGVSGIKGLIGL